MPRGSLATAILLLLLAVTLFVALRVDHLGRASYTLARDLPRSGVVLATLALAAAVARRLFPRRIARFEAALASRLTSKAALAAVVVAFAGGGLLAAAPSLLAPVEPGLTLRIGSEWGTPDSTVRPELAHRLSFGPRSGPAWRSGTAFNATLSGWIYAPITGRYDFGVGADHGVALEIDGRNVARFGYTPLGEPQGVTSDPELGIHRGSVWLGRGFHRIEIASAHGAIAPRLVVRWIPALFREIRTIPPDYLVPDEAPEAARTWRSWALGARRLGTLLLVGSAVLGMVLLVHAATRRASPLTHLVPAITEAAILLIVFARLAESPDDLSRSEMTVLYWGFAGALALGVALRAFTPCLDLARARLAPPRPWLRTTAAVAALVAVQAALTWHFHGAVADRLISSVDHGSFIYRYYVLAHTFPRLVNYDPWWNAGTLDETLVLSGAALVHVLTWPLTRMLPIDAAYVWFIPLTAVAVIPWALFVAARLLGLTRLAALVAGLLALGPGESFALWLFNSGTLPALVAAAMVPLAAALAWRVFLVKDRRWWVIAALAVSVNLGLFWPLFPLMLAPGLLLAAWLSRHRLERADLRLALGLTIVLVVVNAGWILSLAAGPAARQLVKVEARGDTPFLSMLHGLRSAYPMDLNPIVRCAGAVGLLLLPALVRRPMIALAGMLLAVIVVGPELLPDLELPRLVIPLGLLLILPASALLARQIRALGAPRRRAAAIALALLALVTLTAHLDQVWERYGNDDPSYRRQMRFMSNDVAELAAWLREHTTVDARILLTLDFETGLPGASAFMGALTGRPLLSLNMYLNRLVGSEFVEQLTADPERVRENLELLNIRYVVTADHDVAKAGQLHLRASWPDFAVYETDSRSSYLVGAAGSVTFDYNRVAVRLDGPRDEVVLKFRWQPGLYSVPPLPLEPADVGALAALIRVRAGTVRAFEIRY